LAGPQVFGRCVAEKYLKLGLSMGGRCVAEKSLKLGLSMGGRGWGI
jgi:hypothetical protein